MSSRYVTTEYNRHRRIVGRLNDIYARAIAFRVTHARILEEMSALYTLPDYKRLTTYYLGYIAGLQAGLDADIWRNHIVWMLGPASGPTRVVHSEWTAEMSTLCRIPGALYGGHFWTDDGGKPTDKVFTDYKPTN